MKERESGMHSYSCVAVEMAFIFLYVFKLHSWQNLLESTRTCHRSVKYPTGCSRIGLNGNGLALWSADPESAAGVDK